MRNKENQIYSIFFRDKDYWDNYYFKSIASFFEANIFWCMGIDGEGELTHPREKNTYAWGHSRQRLEDFRLNILFAAVQKLSWNFAGSTASLTPTRFCNDHRISIVRLRFVPEN